MRDYRGPPIEPTPEQKQQMKRRRQRARLRSLAKERRTTRRHAFDSTSEYSSSDDTDDTDEDVELIELDRPADIKLRALTRNFFNTFQGLSVGESVCGLDIAGMVDHTEGEHKGHCSILYKLPGTIGAQTRERPAENLMLRAPVSLESLFKDKHNKNIRSNLGSRFKLARKLIRAVCLLHSTGWLHKNIRAESVMFFPEHVNALQEDRYESSIEIDVSKPILMGYIFSRPDDVITRIEPSATPQVANLDLPMPYLTSYTGVWDHGHRSGTPRFDSIYGRDMLGKNAVPKMPTETNISGFKLDYYQHPAKHADPKRLYRHAYDVYSLGVLLLEVGLWEQLHDYNRDEEDHYERRRWICREYLDRLRWACGDTYADVVLSCLMIDSSDDEVARTSERELCARIVADLEGCQA